jgi:hypothetical protein
LPAKLRPLRVAAKSGAHFVALLGIVVQATTFVARLVIIPILTATRSARDLFSGSLRKQFAAAGLNTWKSEREALERACRY